jgi:hypothetical protein
MFSQKNNKIDIYITNLQQSVKEMEKQILYAPPEWQLKIAIEAHNKRIAALNKIKNRESIDKDEYDLLMKMDILKDDTMISDYPYRDNEFGYYCNVL